MNRYVRMMSALALAGTVAACSGTPGTDGGTGGGGSTGGGGGSTGGGGGSTGGGTGFQQPAGTVAVNFSVNDSANKVYTAGNLNWKGSMLYDAATRKITKAGWDGPFPPLFDDGPWTAGGHEPVGETAGDHKWGVTVFVEPPATGSETFEYGLYDTTYSNGWIWRGGNGSFVVNAGATQPITAQGQTFPPFGDKDLRLTIDTNHLLARVLPDGGAASWDTSQVQIKSSGWGWSEAPALDNGQNGDDMAGDGIYSFVLSNAVGAGHQFAHNGLVNSGEVLEFVWVLGGGPDAGPGVEYKDGDYAIDAGVAGGTRTGTTGAFAPAVIDYAGNKNTQINVP